MTLTLSVNRRSYEIGVEPDTALLYVLRNDLELNGPKFGCGLAQCGSCTVLLDGEPIRSCVTPVSEAVGHEVTTLEGLGTADRRHPVQKALIEERAMQCGYCVSGIIMVAAIANAAADATGIRFRKLPLTPSRVKAALSPTDA